MMQAITILFQKIKQFKNNRSLSDELAYAVLYNNNIIAINSLQLKIH